MPDLADKIAERLLKEWLIGWSSRFCDGPPEWDEASQEEVSKVIREVIQSEVANAS